MAAVPEPVPLEGLAELLPAPEPQQPQQVPQNPPNVVPNVAAEVIPFSAIHGRLCFFVSVCLVSYLRFISLSPGSVPSRQFLVTCLSLGLFHFGFAASRFIQYRCRLPFLASIFTGFLVSSPVYLFAYVVYLTSPV